LKRKILWLASWYPNKLEPLSGDFIERHAKAASLLNDIYVIHLVKDNASVTSGDHSIVRQRYADYPNLTSVICYYRSANGLFSSLFSFVKYSLLQRKLIKEYIREKGEPDLINVHISFKAGVGALYAKRRYGIKYIVSEQWTIFCPEARPSFSDQPAAARKLIRKIYHGADNSCSVSTYLARSLEERFLIRKPVRIPNVVDTSLFYYSDEKYDLFTFIHISVLNYQKSPGEIIDAVRLLKQRTTRSFQLIIYGPYLSTIAAKIKEQELEKVIQYRQEVMQDQLSGEVRKCHTLLLYSRFETFGCVVIEALASGLPVIVSDISVMHELVQENQNGIFARIDDPEDLAEKMLWMMENYKSFDSKKISDEAKEIYSFEQIAKQFDILYKSE
jgi:glycosyltransferase involved in cell wall biosynthesis